MKLLELFSGTASMSKVFREYGHEAITVDRLDRHSPSIVFRNNASL